MITTIPASAGEAMSGWTIYNYMTLQNDDDDTEAPANIVCRTTVGDEYAGSVSQYSDSTSW
jgi:hypothetical protein